MMPETFGDEQLATRAADLLGPKHQRFAVARFTPATSMIASRGTELGSDFEIASISKGITGLLYTDAVERGEVRRDSTLGELLPLDGSPVAALTLDSLSTHRSGLPSLPQSGPPLKQAIALWRHGTNPYGENVEELLEQVRRVRVGRPSPRYSNLGFELLGHAVASAAGMSFVELVQDRLAEPLGLDSLYVPATPEQLRPDALIGGSKRGKPREPWTGEALGPAGGLRATITDMTRLARALLDGSAPGIGALDPVAPFGGGTRIGAGWVTTQLKDRSITWHNGGSGGFRSWLGIDRAAGTGVVILTATFASVDRHGFALLRDPVNLTVDEL